MSFGRALYLKQAPWEQYKRFDMFMLSQWYTQVAFGSSDPAGDKRQYKNLEMIGYRN